MKIDQFDTAAVMAVVARPDIVFVEGRGSWMIDHRGKRYLDFVQGWAVNALGHCPPEIGAALARQSRRLINPSPAYFNDAAIALATRLAALSGLPHVFLASSGAEANEGAIKLARKWGGRFRGGAFEVITFGGAFHGRTLATMAASGKDGWDKLFEPKVPGFPKARLNDPASVEALIGPRTAAVMIEPIQGEAGVVAATDAFLRDLRGLCDRHGLLLILDEVQTGVGRTGRMFAFEHTGVRPDILTLGKGIGGGAPLSALLAADRAMCFDPGDQGGTYCGNPLMAAIGLAVIDAVAQPEFLAGVSERGRQLGDGLASLSARAGLASERGRGLLRALDLGKPVAARVAEAARLLHPEGLLVNAPQRDLLRFMPALNVTAEEIAAMLVLLERALGEVQ